MLIITVCFFMVMDAMASVKLENKSLLTKKIEKIGM